MRSPAILKTDIATVLSLVLAWSLLLASCAPASAPPRTPAPAPSLRVKITEPSQGSQVNPNFVVRGNSQPLPAGSTIWVSLFTDGGYYLLDRALLFPSPAQGQAPQLVEWRLSTAVGPRLPRIGDKRVEIISMLADSQSTAELEKLLGTSKDRTIRLDEKQVQKLAVDRVVLNIIGGTEKE